MRPATQQEKLPRQEKEAVLVPGQDVVSRWKTAVLPRQEKQAAVLPRQEKQAAALPRQEKRAAALPRQEWQQRGCGLS
jgi:hypothetical protein